VHHMRDALSPRSNGRDRQTEALGAAALLHGDSADALRERAGPADHAGNRIGNAPRGD
jgi:hypothetical protein